MSRVAARSARPRSRRPAAPGTCRRISETIYEQIRDEITWGRLRPGQRISVRDLAARYRVSMMPVRDALGQLAAEGFTRVSPRRSTVVSEISVQDMSWIFEIRATLEAMAARLACPRVTAADLVDLGRVQREMDRCVARRDVQRWLALNDRFHAAVFARTENQSLRKLIRDLWDRTAHRRAWATVEMPGFIEGRTVEHKEILRMLERRDPDGTERAWREHVVRSQTWILNHLRAAGLAEPPGQAESVERGDRRRSPQRTQRTRRSSLWRPPRSPR